MSWDITIQKFSKPYTAIDQIPDDEQCLVLGTHSEVHAAVSKHFPGTDWSDANWGVFDSPFGSIEFNVGDSDPIDGFMLHVRASEQLVPPIIALCLENNWQALDCSEGNFLELAADPAASLAAWQAYRDQVVGSS